MPTLSRCFAAALSLTILLALSAPLWAADKEDDLKYWGKLTDQESADAIEALRQHVTHTQEKLAKPDLKLYETDFILFATDLEPREAAKWYGLLDKMYARLLQMFDIPKDTNIWHGKVLVYVFQDQGDFQGYMRRIEKYDGLLQAAGVCFQQGPWVRIAFYRQPKEMEFASVLVHESVHGFVHRYRDPARVPNWVNEGLAEWISAELVPKSIAGSGWVPVAKEQMELRGDTAGMFDMWGGQWHYGAAYALTDFMIAKNKRGYVKFFDACKAGEDWREALETHYRVPLDKLVYAYGKFMKIRKPLKP